MYGLTDFVMITVINDLFNNPKNTNYFSNHATVRISMLRTINKDVVGNQHKRSDIQKQAYLPDQVKIVRQAYGLAGLNYSTHNAYRNGAQLSLDDEVLPSDEIMLIAQSLPIELVFPYGNIHRILPDRIGS